MGDRLQPLQDLTRLVFDAELAKLRQGSDEVRACKAEIDRLAAQQASRLAEIAGMGAEPDLALRTGQDVRWQAWVDGERARLARAAAQAAARREAQRQVTERAFGRVEALARLQEKARDERRSRVARRIEN